MIKSLRNWVLAIVGFGLLLPVAASAHVSVTPATVGVGERETFSVSVPNEKEIDVTGIKLDIPSGLEGVTPTVKPGWTISVDKTGTGEDAIVKSITWSGGVIPAGQRDDFTFRALVPEKVTDLQWNAYQTYADGTTVAWNQKPTENESESEANGPYSVTKVTDDLNADADNQAKNDDNILPVVASVFAIVLAAAALLHSYKKK